MSFQNQGVWMGKDAAATNDSEFNYDNSSRIELKRSHQWFMDGPETEVFSNKKQTVGVPTNNLFSGLLNSNVPSWETASGFQLISGHLSERLWNSDSARPANLDDTNISSTSSDKFDIGRKVDENPFGNNFSFGLSTPNSLEDPRSGLNIGGIRKVKVSQVKESENALPVSLKNDYNRVDCNNAVSMAHAYDNTNENTISKSLGYNKGDANVMSMGETCNRESDMFAPMEQTYRENNGAMALSQIFNNGDNDVISAGQSYKEDENTVSLGHLFNKGNDRTILMSQSYNKVDDSNLDINQCYNKGESTIISFGSYDDSDANPSGRLISTYDLLMTQSSLQSSDIINETDVININVDALVSATPITASVTENSKKKEDQKTSKKAPSNSFPTNVRSLLSTGMLDGVPVKYISWSREELQAVIKGSGYLCGCETCSFSKVINAYEFERHANCKTKHPNNHIYFENGRTVYGIVQELRSTPPNMLFEAIQMITGSPINQKSFRLWKESFLAATRELQRIYGKDEGKPSNEATLCQL
ncbi:uncharacterized protein LOC126659810 isoform X2 [Mercurialis annua]|uniref:uncharacterized protein LOC126659810 isoform X2 n=1 Tax=Mercurialis annua TaxID=3986 RepID=UPI00215E468D|nr:uncharacterized protein LOC126659810 isoform X2 [Mercurialis annua]